MNDTGKTNDMPRRRFVTLSGVPPSGQRSTCLKTTPNYVVLHGKPETRHAIPPSTTGRTPATTCSLVYA